MSLAFETDEATDDLTCAMSDGSSMYISAKRACGNDQHFRDTVSQWIGQAATLKHGDRLALAVAQPKGAIRHLGAALDRHRTGVQGYSREEREALTALQVLLNAAGSETSTRILDAACVLKIHATAVGDHEFDLAAAMLENVIVREGSGSNAINALSQSMHNQAGKAFGSTLEDWVRTLESANIPVYADGNGPAGARVKARTAALEAHLLYHSQQIGRIDLSLLADDLTPLSYPELADGLRITCGADDRGSSGGEGLLTIARRWNRMLLVGLPGAGKSTALRQLAASWATRPEAPVPAYISLRRLSACAEQPESITVDLLCDIAAENAAPQGQDLLAAALMERVALGRVVFLLDGLDECGEKAALVSEGLRGLLDSLPLNNGLILSTRGSGARAAERLRLPLASLREPSNLFAILEALLGHIASVRIPFSEQQQWKNTRVRWLREARKSHADLTRVPLLAVLLTLVAAESADDRLPRDKAGLLHTAVRNSVSRWERHRDVLDPKGTKSRLTDGVLLDGYAALGHLIASTTEPKYTEAVSAVSSLLQDQSRWRMAPAEADEVAKDVTWFWDQHVGVFIVSDAQTLQPRSRVFVEIADAMWTTHQSRAALSDWLAKAITDENLHSGLLLAAGINPTVLDILVTGDASLPRPQAILLAADAVLDGVAVTPGQLIRLADQLADCAEHAAVSEDTQNLESGAKTDFERLMGNFEKNQIHRDGVSWRYVCSLSRLALPEGARAHRLQRLRALQLTTEQWTVAAALCSLSDAKCDDRPLNLVEADAVQAMLSLPLPPEGAVRQISRRKVALDAGPRLLTGHAIAAELAIPHLSRLGDNAPQRIHEIAYRGAASSYSRVSSLLADGGHDLPSRWKKDLSDQLHALVEAAGPGRQRPLLEAAAALGNPADSELSPADFWRLPELSDLIDVLGYGEVGIPAFEAAMTRDSHETRVRWLECAAVAAGLDVQRISIQARRVLARDSDLEGLWDVLTAPPPKVSVTLDSSLLTEEHQFCLAASLGAFSDWIATSSCQMLVGVRSDAVSARVLEDMPQLPASRRRLASLIVVLTASDPHGAASALFESDDPPARAGAVAALRHVEHETTELHEILTQAREDADLTVRLSAGAEPLDGPPPTHWSCEFCARYNQLDLLDCGHCQFGTRPGE